MTESDSHEVEAAKSDLNNIGMIVWQTSPFTCTRLIGMTGYSEILVSSCYCFESAGVNT